MVCLQSVSTSSHVSVNVVSDERLNRIIVGVKYCFRYNRRNRQRAQNESGDPIDLSVMQRPHRRRREKKLMTMDEVNERFPLTKYKMWRSSREHEGLPAAGGIAQPGIGSRPASIKEVNESVKPPESAADATQSPLVSSSSPTDKPDEQSQSATSHTHTHDQASKVSDAVEGSDVAVVDAAAHAATSEKPTDKPQEEKSGNGANSDAQSRPDDHHHETDDDEEDEDDPVRAPVQQELLDSPGDTCAICLDNLDDDDDVRGLTCGHAFHASCLDPWLTSRRACCPLCKADYYVPKVRPENPAGNPDEAQMSPLAQTGSRIGIPVTPHGAMIGRVGGGLPFLAFRTRTNNAANTPASPGTPALPQGFATDDAEARQQRSGLGGSILGFAGRFRRNRNNHAGSNLSTSLAQSPQTNSELFNTPATPRSPYLTIDPNNVSSTTPTPSAHTPMTMNVTPSSPSSPSPNWRTRLLPTMTPSRRTRPSTDAASSSFVSRLRRGRGGNDNNDNDSNDRNTGMNGNNGTVGNDGGITESSGMRTSLPPVLPAPTFGGDVITPSQLEAGARA